jgi:hypothetical protein
LHSEQFTELVGFFHEASLTAKTQGTPRKNRLEKPGAFGGLAVFRFLRFELGL